MDRNSRLITTLHITSSILFIQLSMHIEPSYIPLTFPTPQLCQAAMSAFKSLLPSFLRPTVPTHTSTNHSRLLTQISPPSASTLHRKSLTLSSALTAAESHLSALHAQMQTALSAYEAHYAFLRRVAHDAVGSNAHAALQRNTAQLEQVARELEESFEAVDLAVQVARVKARAQREGVEGLLQENKRLRRCLAGGDDRGGELRARARAARRWEGIERESESSE